MDEEANTESYPDQIKQSGSFPLQSGVKWLARKWQWCFKKRLAVYPRTLPTYQGETIEKRPNIYLYEWQKMPKGYRWW